MTKQWTREDCIESFIDLSDSCPDKTITRDFFRKNSPCPEYWWTQYFGTFSEFKSQAGFDFSTHQTKHLGHISKHASKDKLREMNKEKALYEGKYERPDRRKFQTIMTITDTHDINFDPFTKRVFLDTLDRVQPETVVLGGDVFDLPEFSKYFNDPRQYNLIERIEAVHDFLFAIRDSVPDAEINLIAGNHECVEDNTEILTANGWKIAKDVKINDEIASYAVTTGEINYGYPLAIKHIQDQPLIHIKGNRKDELIKYNHNIDYEGKLVAAENFLHSKLDENRFRYFGIGNQDGIDLTDDEIRIITWVVMDGCFAMRNGSIHHIQFKLSKQRKIDCLTDLLKSMNIDFTLSKAKKGENNILQPYYICIYTKAKYIYNLLNGKKELPHKVSKFNKNQLQIFLETLSITDGNKRKKEIRWSSTSLNDVDVVQIACINNEINCYFNIKNNTSGFSSKNVLMKPLYNVVINTYPRKKTSVNMSGFGNVVAIQSKDGTLITRRNGKIAFTGNCRLIRHLAESSPNIMVLLSDLHKFTLSKLLGLDEYEVNFISKDNLAVFTESDLKKEIGKNYLIKFDSVLFHHYPEGKKYGLPGCNGHHHSKKTETLHNLTYGSYEWHQLGAGHIRRATYCDGQKWTNGFMISHHDTHNRSTVFEYVDTTSNHTVVGGKWYERSTDELIVL